MQKWSLIYCLFFVALSFSSCLVMENTYTSVAPGYWRASLQLSPREAIVNKDGKLLPELVNKQMDEVMPDALPFVFEIVYDNETEFHIEVINGSERIRIDSIQQGHDRKTGKDTIVIHFPIYESYITATYNGNIMQGEWVVPTRGNYSIPFEAHHGRNYRFTNLRNAPLIDVSGKWETTFGLDSDDPYIAIGEFKQDNNLVTGTFMTETGDYRFLEGTIQNNKLYLSCFDGSHAFLFEAKVLEDSTLIGSFRSGKHYKTTWKAKRNDAMQLGDPDTLTHLVDGYDKIDFSFENVKGQMVSPDDPAYQNKVKIIQIFGTWCPNCRDETSFLTQYLQKNTHPDLAVIALAFEKYRDKEKAANAIRTYQKTFDIPYEILYAGHYNKKEAVKKLPMLNHILSYPTMIFVDRNNQVRKIHTGFAGPATSEYENFSKEFDAFVKKLLAERS